MTVASLYWARVLGAWSRAQAFLRRLRREKPIFYRFALEVPVGVALSALFYSDGVRALGAALADHPSLRVLSLAHNRLGAATGAALAGALQPCTLASLDVSSNPDLGAAARDALRAALAQRASSGEEKPPAFGAAGTPRALRQARDVIRASEAAEAEQQKWTPRCRDHASSAAASAVDAIASRLSPTARSPGRRSYGPISPVSRLDLSEPLERV